MTAPRYGRPPVVEALCELHFEGSIWDQATPGQFYERVKGEYPTRVDRQSQESGADVRLEMKTLSGSRLLQLAEDLLVINQLRPYPGSFEAWEPAIYEALKAYREVAEPKSVVKIGLRYINRIEIPASKFHMEEYFNIYPELPPTLGDTHGRFMIRIEVPIADQGHGVLYTFATAPTEGSESQAFVLDLYDIFAGAIGTETDQVRTVVRKARELLKGAFEDSITKKLRDLFEMEKTQS